MDAAGWATIVRYDPWGRVRSVESPSGAIRTSRWGRGDLLLETTVEGPPGPEAVSRILSRETYDYDRRGRLQAKTTWSFVDDLATAVALTTRYTWDMDDRLRSAELPRASRIGIAYDGLGRPALLTDQHGTTRESRYDAAGDLHEVTITEHEGGVSRHASWTYEYDARRRLRAVDGASGRTEFEYDDRDEVVERREPGAVTIRSATSQYGELTESLLDPDGLTIRSTWGYDDAGRLAAYIDPTGATTTWEYDRLGRLRTHTLPDGSKWRHDFDVVAGRVENTAPSGTRVSHVLDANNLPIRLECVAGPGVDAVPPHEFAYDALGRLVRATSSDGTVERRYDSVGRMIEETSRGQSVALIYDDVTGAVDLVFPDGRRERTDHDPSGRATRVSVVTPGTLGGTAGEVLADIGYAGRPVTISHSNGVLTTLEYDEPGRLVQIEHASAGEMLDVWRARYDERGRRALVQLAGVPARNTLHRYDASDRLQEARWGFPLANLPDVVSSADHAASIAAATAASAGVSSGESYVLDQADGRQRRTRSDADTTTTDVYTLAPDHRILIAAGQAMTYHADGERKTDSRLGYDVDALGRVVRVLDKASGVIVAAFAYDALSRTATGSVTGKSFVRWFVGATWLHETHGGDVRQASPHPLWPQPLCVIDPAESRFVHTDAGLSTLCVTDGTGTIRERHRYGPFGAPELYAGDGLTPLGPMATGIEPMWRAMPSIVPRDSIPPRSASTIRTLGFS